MCIYFYLALVFSLQLMELRSKKQDFRAYSHSITGKTYEKLGFFISLICYKRRFTYQKACRKFHLLRAILKIHYPKILQQMIIYFFSFGVIKYGYWPNRKKCPTKYSIILLLFHYYIDNRSSWKCLTLLKAFVVIENVYWPQSKSVPRDSKSL